jgi:hypothetical protein
MRKAPALDSGLREMFRALELRPAPDRLISIVDQLDEGEAATPRAARRG